MKLPSSVFLSVSLFTAETAAALYLSTTYRSAGDRIWQGFTLLFTLASSVLVQLTLVFIHRDLSRDRPLVLLLHILQLGPIVRCLEVFCIYGSVGNVEEPYVSITRRRQMPCSGPSEEVERQVGQAEGKLVVHRAAFSRASVVQAFLGSAPQLTLQLYICVSQRSVSVERGVLMAISLLSIVYGALRCNLLAIKMKYEEYEVQVRPATYLCIFLWRSFEIATRVAVLVLFSSVLRAWVLPVVLANLLAFSSYPWVLFWRSSSPFPENVERTMTRVGTAAVLGLLTFLYAGINTFCFSAVQLKLSDPDLVSKSQNWCRIAAYYVLRLVENAALLLLWYAFRTELYGVVCAPLLLLQLLLSYSVAVFFMLLFYRFCHPCRKLFASQRPCQCSCFLCPPCRPRLRGEEPVERAGLQLPDPGVKHGSRHATVDINGSISYDLSCDSCEL